MSTNRIVILVTSVVTLILSILPALLNFDWKSTAGIIAGIIFILTALQTWLQGWQKHEARLAGEGTNKASAIVNIDGKEITKSEAPINSQSLPQTVDYEGEGTGGTDDPYDPGVDTVAPTTKQLIHEQHDIHEADEALGGDDF